jgi:hypothetical protein
LHLTILRIAFGEAAFQNLFVLFFQFVESLEQKSDSGQITVALDARRAHISFRLEGVEEAFQREAHTVAKVTKVMFEPEKKVADNLETAAVGSSGINHVEIVIV